MTTPPGSGPPPFGRATPVYGIPVAPGAVASEPLDVTPRALDVVVVTPDAALRAACLAAVAEAGHAVRDAVRDAAAAWPLLEARRPDLVVVDLDAAPDDTVALVRRLREGTAAAPPMLASPFAPPVADAAPAVCYVLAVVSDARATDLLALVEAGADDFILAPASAERLAARLALATRRIAQVTARLQAESALARAQWLAGIGETSIAIQHEINNPLAALLGHAALLEHGLVEPGEEREILGVVVEQAHRIGAVIKRLAALRDPRTVEYLRGARMLDLSKEK